MIDSVDDLTEFNCWIFFWNSSWCQIGPVRPLTDSCEICHTRIHTSIYILCSYTLQLYIHTCIYIYACLSCLDITVDGRSGTSKEYIDNVLLLALVVNTPLGHLGPDNKPHLITNGIWRFGDYTCERKKLCWSQSLGGWILPVVVWSTAESLGHRPWVRGQKLDEI